MRIGWTAAVNTTDGKALLVSIESLLGCCGFASVSDMPALPCPASAVSGCLLALHDLTQSQLLYIAVAGLIVALFEIASLVVSCFLHADPEKERDDRAILRA
eukprot:EC714820.1.p2 GENE.EC714820.1~~EC714820.1.p2  ORF type:complete len:102 (+),score=27.45 EC714820.1:1-306(+)